MLITSLLLSDLLAYARKKSPQEILFSRSNAVERIQIDLLNTAIHYLADGVSATVAIFNTPCLYVWGGWDVIISSDLIFGAIMIVWFTRYHSTTILPTAVLFLL